MSIWIARIFFLVLCTISGFAVSYVKPDLVEGGWIGVGIGFGLGGLVIAFDEFLKGFSLRAFSAATFGLFLGMIMSWIIDQSGLFIFVDESTRWMIRLSLFLSFGYIGIILAMRSNKEDFYLIIPFVRFSQQKRMDDPLIFDTSAIIDGRIMGLIDHKILEGVIIVPRFVLKELQQVADSKDPLKRARGRKGLEVLNQIQNNSHLEVKIHQADVSEEMEVDLKLIRLAKILNAKLITNDYNLSKIAELQGVSYLNLHEMAACLKSIIIPGEEYNLQIVREGKDQGQGIAYLSDGTMVVVNQAQDQIGKNVEVKVISLHQTGAGVIIFADLIREAA